MNITKQHLCEMVLEKRIEVKWKATAIAACLFGTKKGKQFHHGLLARLLMAGDSIELRGFGTFYTKERKARPGNNFRTGKRMVIPARRVALFTFSPDIKSTLNPS